MKHFSKTLWTIPDEKFYLPPRKYFGKSIIGWSNILFFQWLFVRMGWQRYNAKPGVNIVLFGFVWPLTGWWSDYVYVGK